MTLVVGRIDGCNIFIESDSKISNKDFVKSEPLCGLLKTFVVHPFVCFSFAGDPYYAEEVLKIIFEKQRSWNNQLFLKMLLDINKVLTKAEIIEVTKVELFEFVRKEYFNHHKSIRQIAKEQQVHRRQVRRAIENAVPPPRRTAGRTYLS